VGKGVGFGAAPTIHAESPRLAMVGTRRKRAALPTQ